MTVRKVKLNKVKKMESSGVIETSSCRSNDIGSGKDRRVGLIFDERMCKHYDPSDKDHPERPDRIKAIWDLLNSSGLAKRCIILKAKDAEDNHLALVHTKNHIDLIKNISSKNSKKRKRIAAKFDSIYFNEGSTKAAYLAAGSVIEAAEKVVKGELDSAFAIVRPPGHHAKEGEPMGFCLYNNVGIATSYLLNERRELGIKKILIVDWDVHHGNGTQKMFYKDPRVLLFSVHRYDNGTFYPGGHDGSYIMTGEETGAGHNINVPWDHERCGDADYLAVWDHILIPVAKEFNPDMIFISAGFDAAIGDPLGGCSISPYGYSVMLDKLMEFAGGNIVMALEGGYNLKSIASSARACVEVLLHDKPPNVVLEASPFAATWRLIQEVRRELSTYWPVLASEIPGNMVCQTAPINDWCDKSPTECYDFFRSLSIEKDKSRPPGLTPAITEAFGHSTPEKGFLDLPALDCYKFLQSLPTPKDKKIMREQGRRTTCLELARCITQAAVLLTEVMGDIDCAKASIELGSTSEVLAEVQEKLRAAEETVAVHEKNVERLSSLNKDLQREIAATAEKLLAAQEEASREKSDFRCTIERLQDHSKDLASQLADLRSNFHDQVSEAKTRGFAEGRAAGLKDFQEKFDRSRFLCYNNKHEKAKNTKRFTWFDRN